jgi:hypothetical protein
MDNLQRILSIALLEDHESDVTGLAFAILGEAGKDYSNGYTIRVEHHLEKRIRKNISSRMQKKSPVV